jgi:single-stranded-DNA-specific exonuclease
VEVERIDEFREAFNEIATKILEKKELRPQILIDAEIGFSEITNFFRETLQKFIPYGPSNMRPVFIVKNVEVIGLFKIGGNDRIKMKLRHGNIFIEAIGFNLSEKQAEIDKAAKHIDIIFSVEELDKNYNRQPIQLKLRDFKASLS